MTASDIIYIISLAAAIANNNSSSSTAGLFKMMDELEQKCHDLEFKVRRLEEERNETLHENDDLQDQIDVLRTQAESHQEKPDHFESDILRMSEEIARLDGILAGMNQSITTTTEKLKEVNDLKEALRYLLIIGNIFQILCTDFIRS